MLCSREDARGKANAWPLHQTGNSTSKSHMESMESLGKPSTYGYLLASRGMCRVRVPDFDALNQSPTPSTETEVEPLFTCEPKRLLEQPGFFSSGHNVYMVGGSRKYVPMSELYVFDPTTVEKFPVHNPSFLGKPIADIPHGICFTEDPIVIQPINDHKIYFITEHRTLWIRSWMVPWGPEFSSYDPIEKRFHLLPSPDYVQEKTTDPYREIACFAAGDYIYLFIQDHLVSSLWHHDSCEHTRVFSFNIKTSEWNEVEDTVLSFEQSDSPLPFFHRGHAGLSTEFPDKTRIMVATCDSDAIAYCVRLGVDGSIMPKSYRYLLDRSHITKDGCISQLHDIGSGRFLVFFHSESIPFRLYVFQINYDLEHQIQNLSAYAKAQGFTESSKVIWSTKFLDDIPSFGYPAFHNYCLAYAPTPQTSGNQTDEQVADQQTEISPHERKGTMLKGQP